MKKTTTRKKKKVNDAVVQKLRDLLTAKSEIEKSLIVDLKCKEECEQRITASLRTLQQAQIELSKLSDDLEKEHGKGSEINIETGEIKPSGVFE